MKPSHSYLVPCTSDQWADYLSDLRVYQTEENWRTGYSIMYSKLSPNGGYARPGFVVGEVHYLPNGEKEYFVMPAGSTFISGV